MTLYQGARCSLLLNERSRFANAHPNEQQDCVEQIDPNGRIFRALTHNGRGKSCSRIALAHLAALVVATAGCRDFSRFDLPEGETYCGSLVGAPVFHEGLIREGAPPVLRLRLELDVTALDSVPGTITSDDQNRGLCRGEGGRLFDGAKLRAVQEVQHDALSGLQFGEGREHNLLAYVDSSCMGTLVCVLSLMQNGDVELRVLKPAPEPASDAGQRERPGYGLFHLKAQDAANCDF